MLFFGLFDSLLHQPCVDPGVDIKSRQEKFNFDKNNNICLCKIAFLKLRCWPGDRRLRSRVQYRKRIESAIFFESIDTFQNCQNIDVSNIWYRVSAHPYWVTLGQLSLLEVCSNFVSKQLNCSSRKCRVTNITILTFVLEEKYAVLPLPRQTLISKMFVWLARNGPRRKQVSRQVSFFRWFHEDRFKDPLQSTSPVKCKWNLICSFSGSFGRGINWSWKYFVLLIFNHAVHF